MLGTVRADLTRCSGESSRTTLGQPRGRVSRFSLDALVNISTALVCRVRVDLDAA
jgi:hypothetical protein